MSDNNSVIERSSEKKTPSPQFLLLLTIFIDITGFGMIFPLLPYYALRFGVGAFALGLLTASFALMQFLFSPIMGRLSDKFGRRPILLFSIFTSTLSFTFFTFANSFLMLLLSRISAGIATEISVAQAYMADITTEEERAKGLGKVQASMAAGTILGPVIGGLLSIYGFWVPGLFAVFLTIINLIFVYFFLPESLTIDKRESLEKVESKEKFSQVISRAMKIPIMSSLMFISFILAFAFTAMPILLPLIGIEYYNLDQVQMSFIFVYFGIIQIILQGVIIGRLVKKFGESKLIPLGTLILGFNILIMGILPNLLLFFLLMGLVAFGAGLIRTSIPSIITKKVPENERGGLLGVFQAISSIAMIPGPLIAGFLFEYAGIAVPFILSTCLMIIAFLFSLRIHFQIKKLKEEIEV